MKQEYRDYFTSIKQLEKLNNVKSSMEYSENLIKELVDTLSDNETSFIEISFNLGQICTRLSHHIVEIEILKFNIEQQKYDK